MGVPNRKPSPGAARERYGVEEIRAGAKLLASRVKPGMQPWIERLANDPEILELASHAYTDTLMPHLLLASTHYRILQGFDHPLTPVFERLFTEFNEDDYALFQDYCRADREALIELLRTRRIQTHDITRCGALYPALCWASREVGARHVALVDIGAAAGFHLPIDHYGYSYQGSGPYCDAQSPVQVDLEWRGERPPDLAEFLDGPMIVERIGIDLRPVDLHDADDLLWLKAFGQHPDPDTFAAAAEITRNTPHTMIQGDALEVLPRVLSELPQELTPVVLHSFTTIQFYPEMGRELTRVLDQAGAKRDLVRVSLDNEADAGAFAEIRASYYRQGQRHDHTVALCEGPHWLGSGFDWKAPLR